MGFAVLEVNHRGCTGYGFEHWQAGRQQLDAVVVQDVTAALDALAAKFKLDLRRVALFGESFGGYLALRCAQLDARFSCVVAIDAEVDLNGWLRPPLFDSPYFQFEHATRRWFFGADEKRLKEQSPIANAAGISMPAMLVAFDDEQERTRTPPLSSFRSRLTKAGQSPFFLEVTSGARVPGKEKADLYRQVGEFLVKNLAPERAAK